jgi:hypothetical protein
MNRRKTDQFCNLEELTLAASISSLFFMENKYMKMKTIPKTKKSTPIFVIIGSDLNE